MGSAPPPALWVPFFGVFCYLFSFCVSLFCFHLFFPLKDKNPPGRGVRKCSRVGAKATSDAFVFWPGKKGKKGLWQSRSPSFLLALPWHSSTLNAPLCSPARHPSSQYYSCTKSNHVTRPASHALGPPFEVTSNLGGEGGPRHGAPWCHHPPSLFWNSTRVFTCALQPSR